MKFLFLLFLYTFLFVLTPYYPTLSSSIMFIIVLYIFYITFNSVQSEDGTFYRRKRYLLIILSTSILAAYFISFNKLIDSFDNYRVIVNDDNVQQFYMSLFSIIIPEVLFLVVAFVIITFSYDFIDKSKKLLDSATHLVSIKEKLQIKDIDNLTNSIIDEYMETFSKTIENLVNRGIQEKDIKDFYKNLNAFAIQSSQSISEQYLNEKFKHNIENVKIISRNKYIIDHNIRFESKKGYLATFAFYSDVVSSVIEEFSSEYDKRTIKFLTTFSAPIKDWFRKDKAIQTEWGLYLSKLRKIVTDDNIHLERILLYLREEGSLFDGKEKEFFKQDCQVDEINDFYNSYHTQKGSLRNSFICDVKKQTLIDFAGKNNDYLKDFFVVCDVTNNKPILALGIAEGSAKTSFELITIDFTNQNFNEKYEEYIIKFIEEYNTEESTLLKKENLKNVYQDYFNEEDICTVSKNIK